MSAMERLRNYIYQGVYNVSGPFHPFGGAVDIVVVQQQDGTFKSSPWYVCFGKFQGVLKSREKIVNISVNGSDAGFHMYLDSKGEAFFLHSTDLDAEDSATSSLVSSGDEGEDKMERKENENLNEGGVVKGEEEQSENRQLNEGHIVKRTRSKRSAILELMFGRRSSKNKGNGVERISSLERAEIAADLLEMKWSTNLSLHDRRGLQLNSSNMEGQDETSLDNCESANGIVEEVSVRGVELNSTNLGVQNENSVDSVESVNVRMVEEVCARGLELNSANLRDQNENLVDNGESVNVRVVEEVFVRGVDSDSTILRVQDENLADNDLEKVVKIQSTDISNEEIELHEKSYTITEKKITSEEVCVKGIESDSTNLRGQNEILVNKTDVNSSLNNCFNDSLERNKEKLLEKNEVLEKFMEIDYIGGREINHRLDSVNSDFSDLHPPDSIDTSSDVSIDKVLEVSSGEYLSDKNISQVRNLEILVSENLQTSLFESPNNKLDQDFNNDVENEICETRECISLQTNEIESDQFKDEKSGISFSGNSEDLQFNFSDGEGETGANEKEAMERDNEEPDITSHALNGSDLETHFESSPICIPSTSCSGTRNVNMAISLPNLWYDVNGIGRDENIERLSSSLGLKSEVKRDNDSFSSELDGNCEDNLEMGQAESEITGQVCDGSKPDMGDEEASSINPLVELSLCKHLLYEGMGEEAARKAFDSQKLTLEKFCELGPPNLIKNDKLIVRIKNQYFPYDSAAPAVLGLASFGEESLDLKGMIRVDQAHPNNKSIVPAGGSWQLWPFGFRRSRSVSTYSVGNLEEIQGVNCKYGVKKVRSLTPSSEELASLGLNEGCNNVTFTFSTAVLGNQQIDARIFLWKWNMRIVISDVDGTITKSDVLGQFMPLVGVDWSQTGVAHLFSAIKDNGYQLLFLSARAISQAHLTRQFLFNLKQDGKALPDGPVVISPDGLFPSLYREVIRRAPHEFKISCLEAIKALFPADCNPFYAGFGNRDTDELSYMKVGIPIGKIFIINPKGEVAVNRRVDTKSYFSLHALVHGMFPPYSSPEQEVYNDYNFWKLPMREIDL